MQREFPFLKSTLVISVKKSFWASKECEIFPNRIYTKKIFPAPGRFGSSRNPINNITAAIQGYFQYLTNHPKLIIIGSSTRVAPWLVNLKKNGFLSDAKILSIGQGYLNDASLEFVEKVIVYSNKEVSLHEPRYQPKYKFIHLPADGKFDILSVTPQQEYIFSGGGAGRDFTSLIEAVRGLNYRLKIITFSQKTLNYKGKLPENCQVYWKIPPDQFLSRMAHAKFVVAPLIEGSHPHGQTTVVQALRLGKPVISTRNSSIDDYITHLSEGILVEPGDIQGYRKAVVELYENNTLHSSLKQNAFKKAQLLTYSAFRDRLVECVEECL